MSEPSGRDGEAAKTGGAERVPVRDASTVVLLRPAEAGPAFEVFVVRRHAKSGFMGGVTVFPGGKCDEGDSAAGIEDVCTGRTAAECARVLGLADPARAISHYVAAIRETFEEAGVLLAVRRDGSHVPDSETLRSTRASLQMGAHGIREAALEQGFLLDLGRLVYFDHWVTPAVEHRRFSTRFFAALVPHGQRADHDARETTQGAWVSPQRALALFDARELDLAPPTLRTLQWAASFATAGMVLAACSDAPVEPKAPVLVRAADHPVAGRPMLVLCGDPLHPDAPGARPRRFWQEDGRWISRWTA